MATVTLKHVYKVYENSGKKKGEEIKPAVSDFCMDIEDKEFIVFVGPSGCGKSTTLRMIAGLEDITEGEIYIGDLLVNDVEPKDRDISMVFQNYALYPHMTVYDNMAFALKLRKIPREERDKSTIVAKDKNGKPLNFVQRLFARTYEEVRDEKSEIVYKEDGTPEYVPVYLKQRKNEKDSTERQVKKDKNGNVVYKKRRYTIDEYAGKPILDENGRPKYIAVLNKDGEPKKDKLGNIIYKKRKYTKQEINEKVHAAAKILDIDRYLERKPKALSGGQRQRVALGRAIVRMPKVFLLDEPLSNLDAKLRAAMRAEIIKLHEKLGTTFIYVTHDQVEAMTMGTRIVVMKDGFVQQIGAPQYLFENPVNVFVAGFIGSPQMNLFDGHVTSDGVVTFANGQKIVLPKEEFNKFDKEKIDDGTDVVLGIRPGDIKLAEKPAEGESVSCKVTVVEVLGTETIIYADLDMYSEDIKKSSTVITASVKSGNIPARREVINLQFDLSKVQLFEKSSGLTLKKDVH